MIGLALGVLLWSRRLRQESGLPSGPLLTSDTDSTHRGKPLTSRRYGLTGTPDYVVRTPEGHVPVEVKPSRTDPEPLESHLLQVLAYCLLLEEEGEHPPYGLLRYSSGTFKVDYNSQTRQHIIDVITEMRQTLDATGSPARSLFGRGTVEVHRNHEAQAKCRKCAYRTVCDEAL